MDRSLCNQCVSEDWVWARRRAYASLYARWPAASRPTTTLTMSWKYTKIYAINLQKYWSSWIMVSYFVVNTISYKRKCEQRHEQFCVRREEISRLRVRFYVSFSRRVGIDLTFHWHWLTFTVGFFHSFQKHLSLAIQKFRDWAWKFRRGQRIKISFDHKREHAG